MNLDSLSLALSEISYSVANLTKKNFKSSVAEISHLVTHHGAETERHLFRCLFSYVDFSGDGKSSGKDFHQTQLLIQEFGNLISKVNFVSILCYAIDCPLHLQKSLKPSSQLFPQVSKVLKLTRVQDVIFGLALLNSSNPDLRNYAAQFVKQKLPDLIRSYVDADTTVAQEGGLQDVAIEVIHLLLAHLVKGKDQFGIGADQKEAFLRTLRKDFPRDRVPVVLSPLLYPDIDDISLDKLPETSAYKSMMESSIADMILEAGYGCTASVEECRNTLMQFGVRELTPASVARVLGMMARTHQGLNESTSAQQSLNTSSLGGGGIWGDTKEKTETAGVNTWNVEVFVQVVQDLAPHLNWREVVSELDHPEFFVDGKKALGIIVRGLIKGLIEVFPVELIYRQWKNTEGQLSFIVQSIRNPDVFCLADYPCHTVVIDILKTPPDDEKREILTWKSLDLVEALLRLSEQHNQQVSELFNYPVRNCPDMLVLALLQISPTWNTLKQELISTLMPIFLGNHPNSAIVLHYAWHCQGHSSTIRTLIMHSMAEWYMRGEPHDQTRLGRILDVAQDLKALSMLLNASPFAFVIDLACLASRREYLKLDKWLSDKIREHREPFIQACATFLKRRCPQLVGGMVKDDPTPQSKSQQLPMETIGTMVACLHTCANSGQVQIELSEAIRTMVNNANVILNKARQVPPGAVGPKPLNPGLPQALPLPTTPVEAKPPDPMLQQWSTWQSDKKKLDGPSILGPVGLGTTSNVSSSFPQGLMNLNPAPPSPPKGFQGLPTQSGHGFNAMHSITTQLQNLGLPSTMPTSMPVMQGPRSSVTSLGTLSVQTALKNPGTHGPSGRPRQGNGGDMSNFFPDMNQQFSKEVEDEANSYFQRIYNNPRSYHPTMSTDEALDMLKRFKDSPNKKENDVHACILRSLLEEYRFFQQYPEKELHITAVLFGGIIEQGLVTYMALGIALRYVLEALRKPVRTRMYFFGITALDRFKSRLKDYPQYCTHLASIPHFNQFPQHLMEYVEYGARSQEPPHHPQGPITTRSLTPTVGSLPGLPSSLGMPPLTPTPTSSGTPMEGLNTGTATPTSAAPSTPAEATAANSPAAPSKSAMPKPSIANATNIDTLLAGQGKEEISVPPESLQDKVFFIFNNLSLANMSQKSEELKEYITEEFMPWVSQYLVMKRASIEPNFHTLYANFIDTLQMPNITTNVTKETFRNIKVLLRSDKGVANFSDRALLKNLGHWLGMLTLAKNKPILQIDIDLKALLYEAYHKGAQELLYVVPFTAKVLESCSKSKVFKPPNPWTMAIMNVLSELHQEQNLKLNLKFEIEVLCKTLGIDITDLKPGNYLRDPHRLSLLEPQLSGATKLLSPQPDLDPVTSVSTPPAVPVTVGGSASTSTPSVSLPPQSQFAFNDINTSSLAGLAPHITISDHPLWQANAQLKQSVRAAVDRSVQELLPPVVERAIKIALNTCEQIVKKDFALDPEENRMRAAAHHMVRNMTAGLALITCREPLFTCINNNLKTTFTSALRGLTQPHKDMVEQAAQMVAQENVELACAFIQKTAVERAIPEMDKRLATEFDLRKHARNEGRRYCDPVVLTYQAERMPEQIRLKVGGVTQQQIAVYEEFARNIPGFLPTFSDTSLPSGIARPMPVRDQSYATDEIGQIYDKIVSDMKQHLQVVALPPGNPYFVQLHSLMEAVAIARGSRDIVTALALLQKAVEGLLDNYTGLPSENESMLRFRDCHLLVLRGLQDTRAYGSQWTNKQVTKCLIDSRDDRKYNVEAVDCLIRAHFVNIAQYDLHLATLMDNGLNYMAVAFAMQLVQRYFVDDKLNSQISETEMFHTIDTLARIATHSRQAPEGLTALIETIRQNNETGLERTPSQGGPTVMMQSGINQAREFDDPPGLHEKTEYLLREWVNMYHSPAAGRDSTKAFSAFVGQMHQQGILKTDDLITRFFRLCTEMCVDLCYRALSEQSQSPTLVRAKCFHTLDAFVRLITLLVKYSGDNTNTVTKINLLNKVLGIVAGVLYQDHEVRQSEFQQLPYHRIFIMLFIELNAPEPILDTINLQVLTAFCNTFHILRPAKAPGFAYAWLELVSHRVFIGRLLALTTQQRGWGMYAQLLIDLFKFLSPFLRNADLTKPTQLLYKGTLRVLLVLLHDFPEFLCDFHYAFCDVIPPNCIQMRNLILSAFPRNMRLPDPFTPNLKVDMLSDIAQPPRILTNFSTMIQPAAFKKNLDSYLKTRSPVTFLSELRGNLKLQTEEPGMKYNIPLINALVLYVGTQAITYIHSKGLTPSMSTIAHSSHMDIFQNMGVSLDSEGRYLFLNAIANQLRYPNSHTHYFSCTLLYLFAEANTEAIQEQITRVLLERLIVNRPHPWGVLITFIELIKNPIFKFWNHDFVHCAPEIENLFESVARSCMQPKQGQTSREPETPEIH